MSTFAVKVRKIQVSAHPNADLLEVGRVDDYDIVVKKGQFRDGELIVYIPEQAIVPDPLIAEMGLQGRLSGADTNRVKAVKLRGCVSQGLAYKPELWPEHWTEGLDVGAELGIIKWEPPIPTEMAGKVEPAPGNGFFRSYTDIENIQSFPHVLPEGIEVRITEKLHGSCAIVGIIDGVRVVSSKGVATRGLCITENPANVYWKVAHQEGLFAKLENYLNDSGQTQVLLFGEVVGVQDLMYGLNKGTLGYRAFDLYTTADFMNADAFSAWCDHYSVPPVPVLYAGRYDREVARAFVSGTSRIAGHMREGIVIRPVIEDRDPEIGRLILKWVSPEYLTRKGGTELQ